MITKAGKELAEKFLELQRSSERSATYAAVEYAQTNIPAARESFVKHTETAALYGQVYALVCRGVQAVETELINKKEN